MKNYKLFQLDKYTHTHIHTYIHTHPITHKWDTKETFKGVKIKDNNNNNNKECYI